MLVFTKASVLFPVGQSTYVPFLWVHVYLYTLYFALLCAPCVSKYSSVLFYFHLLPGKTQRLVKDTLCCADMAGIQSPNGIQTVVGFFPHCVFQPCITCCVASRDGRRLLQLQVDCERNCFWGEASLTCMHSARA